MEERSKRDVQACTSLQMQEYFGSGRQTPSRRRSSFMHDISEYLDASIASRHVTLWPADREEAFFTRTTHFTKQVETCRNFLLDFVSSHLLDALTKAARREGTIAQAGYLFCFSVLCNKRLAKLVACHHDEESSKLNQEDVVIEEDTLPPDWSNFLGSAIGSDLFLACLSQLSGLASLTLHNVCTNDMLYVISETCSMLQVLDISYSSQVTDLGLIYLCGVINASNYATKSSSGCKYLRELKFNPQSDQNSSEDQKRSVVMPKVVASLLRHLKHLEVVDLECLHEGIEYYFHGPGTHHYHPKPDRIAPLKLVHYTGSDRLAQVMKICPKLRTFKLFVTDSLPELGATLQNLGNSLDHVTLVYSHAQTSLVGLQEFLAACGGRINSLEIECRPETQVSLSDLRSIAEHCKFLDILCFTSFTVAPPSSHDDFSVPFVPLNLPFVTEIRLSNIYVERFGKEVFRYLLGGCPDIERLYLSFADTAYFFDDFLLDDVLLLNPLGRLERFVLKDVSLTLISALRLISSRPKLRTIGKLLKWDVEPSELLAFTQILRNANAMKLLQEIDIV